MIAENCAASASRRPIADEEILSRRLYILINEGARLLAEGDIVERPSDIDLATFTARLSGRAGRTDALGRHIGLDRVHEAIVSLHRRHDDNWALAPLLGELARSGRRFADLDAAAVTS